MSVTYSYLATDEDPSIPICWLDRNGDAIDLSTATFSAKLVSSAGTTAVTKTTGITGYSALQGTSPDPQYNALIVWAAGELAGLAGTYKLVFTATVSGRQRTFAPSSSPVVVVTAAPT
jgi:hypothetical protein